MDVKRSIYNRSFSRSADDGDVAYVHGAVFARNRRIDVCIILLSKQCRHISSGSLTFYFVAPRLGNASGVLSVIPYVAVATLMIPFMTLYKPAKKEPAHAKR
jgi:hypothetical protein